MIASINPPFSPLRFKLLTGELLFDVELCMVADDENDQGYYDDEPVTQEEVR